MRLHSRLSLTLLLACALWGCRSDAADTPSAQPEPQAQLQPQLEPPPTAQEPVETPEPKPAEAPSAPEEKVERPVATDFDRSCTQREDCVLVRASVGCEQLCECPSVALSRAGAEAFSTAGLRYIVSLNCPKAHVMKECKECGPYALSCEDGQCKARFP